MAYTGARRIPELHVIIGPMFSGKSTSCVGQLKRQTAVGDTSQVMVVKSTKDTRDPEGVRTHDSICVECHRLEELMSIQHLPGFVEAKVILIDESQFFDDLVEGVRFMLDLNKSIYVYGLDGDRHQQPFGKICELIPLADSVEKKLAICNFCGKDAPFTISDKDDLPAQYDQCIPGGVEMYSAVCRTCLKQHKCK
jgi:thymidine kinase